MSFIVKSTDKRTGVTYVYESESYWDKEKKQPRAKRKLIGKIDEETGEIVPTASRGRKKKDPGPSSGADNEASVSALKEEYTEQIRQKDIEIALLEQELTKLKAVVARFLKDASDLITASEPREELTQERQGQPAEPESSKMLQAQLADMSRDELITMIMDLSDQVAEKDPS